MTALTYPWHQAPWQQVSQMQTSQRLPHALLLSGIKGLGKQDFAKALVARILCLQPSDDFAACGHCHSCLLLAADTHPDHKVVAPEDTGKQIKVDQIRDLKASQTLMPKVSAAKTVIITHADQMNISAYNSLLKLLEEPQPNTVLILISENSQQLPITIRSRCQTIVIPVPDQLQSLDWLSKQSPSRSAEDWQLLLKLCHGAPLEALANAESTLEQSQVITRDIASLMKGQANPVQMAAHWQQFDLKSVLYQLQNMMQAKIESLLLSENTVSAALIKQYWAISDCIIDTIKLISSQNNLNKILLIEDFMVTVMQHADQIRLIQGTNR
jgi:DNA polymerase-3 subunit delta'